MGKKAKPAAGSPKKPVKPDFTKKFTNGHVCQTGPEQMALQECYTRESRARNNFYDTVSTMKQNRNVVLGEKTSREDAPPLVPPEWLPKPPGADSFEVVVGTSSAKTYNAPFLQAGKVYADASKVDSLRRRKQEIQEELAMMDQILRHKKMTLQFSSGGKSLADSTLHPAMGQKITRDQVSIPYIS
jgi:hypothetical protein